jgi:hypothetical protein
VPVRKNTLRIFSIISLKAHIIAAVNVNLIPTIFFSPFTLTIKSFLGGKENILLFSRSKLSLVSRPPSLLFQYKSFGAEQDIICRVGVLLARVVCLIVTAKAHVRGEPESVYKTAPIYVGIGHFFPFSSSYCWK